jgi:hypothetical protein
MRVEVQLMSDILYQPTPPTVAEQETVIAKTVIANC